MKIPALSKSPAIRFKTVCHSLQNYLPPETNGRSFSGDYGAGSILSSLQYWGIVSKQTADCSFESRIGKRYKMISISVTLCDYSLSMVTVNFLDLVLSSFCVFFPWHVYSSVIDNFSPEDTCIEEQDDKSVKRQLSE